MGIVGSITQCKVQQCSQCQGDTEFYCNTCNRDLCPICKEKHVTYLDTLNHDVVIYREKLKIILKQEPCVRHPDMIYERYCYSCELPFCARCTEQRNLKIVPSFLQRRKHSKHNTMDIRTAYKVNRSYLKDFIHSIRSQTLYKCCFLLSRIKTDLKTKISNRQLEMSSKAQRLKGRIDTVVFAFKLRPRSLVIQHINFFQKQIRIMNGHLASIEKYEQMSEQSANKPVSFLFFLKNINSLKLKETPNLKQLARFSHTERINMEGVIELLSEIQITERGRRQVRDEYVLKLMSKPVLQKSITVTGVHDVRHISRVSSDQVWISDGSNLILTNTIGGALYRLKDIDSYYGIHTLSSAGDLIYIDKHQSIKILSKETTLKSTLIEKTKQWKPLCVYCSPSNGDLLVGMWDYRNTSKLNLYNNSGQHIQKIESDYKGQKLYTLPKSIAENNNGDVIVSDTGCVVVTDGGGRHRFSYTGTPSGSTRYLYRRTVKHPGV